MASPANNIPLALVTAGSAGLGAAVAELFARNGMRVAINYHGNAQRAEDLVGKLKSISTLVPKEGRVDYHAIKADLSVRTDVERLVKETMSAMCPDSSKPQLDVVFSNGGWTRMTNLMDLEEAMVDDDWDRCFTMNVKSHLWLLYAAKPYLEAGYSEKDGASSFITTASLAGVKVSGSSLAYSVTKAAQLQLAKGLAMIAAPKIRVNSVSPGLLLTEWGLKFPPERIKAMQEASKLKRIATVEDVAEQVMAFVRAKSVSGQNMVLDGGFGMPW
ncbi:hypothetical protein N0V93_001102 [Gnomoniopsis smithogilvyi]|uniref:Short-chain dehydrogenase n=1 Tax=Gnomoniopsis smithogilvyi TaxID=1191159 RepID=A0A9W8Z3E0_9PEZI|nr:hypothetical protein N0V93_001102 [Gnomoniopsis smithogilvyi]